jgi:DNA topoisomerase-2
LLPLRYIPIIPLVLVNGSEGIGTGWSSYIPNYNPREISANVRRLLNGEEMVPMDPWYRGFKGTIEKSAKEGGYIVSGSVEEIDEQTFRITELPIRKWTQDYKQFLESITDGTPNVKDPLIEVASPIHILSIYTIGYFVPFSYVNFLCCRILGKMGMMKL